LLRSLGSVAQAREPPAALLPVGRFYRGSSRRPCLVPPSGQPTQGCPGLTDRPGRVRARRARIPLQDWGYGLSRLPGRGGTSHEPPIRDGTKDEQRRGEEELSTRASQQRVLATRTRRAGAS